MTALAKAELAALDGKGRVTDTIPVQFNPSSMRIQMSNSVDGGASRGRQTQQYNGSASTTLTLDLEFDTADEGTNANPVDVRTRTDRVRQFVLPGGTRSKQAPPRARFRWGTFELTGVMDSLSEDLTFFSAEGVPLRSKVSLSIKEQDSRFAALERGPGANDDTNPPGAGEAGGGAGPGTSGGGVVDRAAAALAGETPAEFLARNGLAPDAWRALGEALDVLGEGIELEAGLAVGFSAGLSVSAGLGVSAGFQAGLDLPVDASLGLAPSAGAAAGGARTEPGLGPGFALAAAGGLTAAANQAASTEAAAAAAAARASFDLQPSPPPAPATTATAARSPLAGAVGVAPGALTVAQPRPVPPTPDARAATFGRGVPLRDRIEVPGAGSDGYVVLGRPSPVEALPPARAVEREQGRRRPACGCHRCDPLRRAGRR